MGKYPPILPDIVDALRPTKAMHTITPALPKPKADPKVAAKAFEAMRDNL